uniref:Uncharacterized protein n=1 Tax=Scophthalmus maximus TaxID=52904 RepID=A0A8D2ZTT5_SCOMX
MNKRRMMFVAKLSKLTFKIPSWSNPLSLVFQCYCRLMVRNVQRGGIPELCFSHNPTCP